LNLFGYPSNLALKDNACLECIKRTSHMVPLADTCQLHARDVFVACFGVSDRDIIFGEEGFPLEVQLSVGHGL